MGPSRNKCLQQHFCSRQIISFSVCLLKNKHFIDFIWEPNLIILVSFNPAVAGLFRASFLGLGKISPCFKLVRIMLETWNLARNYVHICSFRKYSCSYQDSLNFANVSIFLAKNSKKKSPSTQSNGMRAVLEIFSHVFGSCKIKGYTINENVSFRDHTSRIRFPDCSKFTINRRNDNDVKIYGNDLIVNFFCHFRVSLVKFSY